MTGGELEAWHDYEPDSETNRCRNCSEAVSSSAKECPHCGEPWPASNTGVVLEFVQSIFWLGASLMFLYVMLRVFGWI